MMANWDILNKEFYQVLNSFQDSDWDNWASIRASKKEMRRLDLILKAKIQEEKIKLTQFASQGSETIPNLIVTTESYLNESSVSNTQTDVCGECNYALAA